MSASAEQIAELRGMIAEPTEDTYSDEALAVVIEKFPVLDERGEVPYTWDSATTPPTKTTNTNWIETYDLNAAAAKVWGEKAAALTGEFDFRSDDQGFDRSQKFRQAKSMSLYYSARRRPTTFTSHKYPKEDTTFENVIGNLPERDDDF